MVGNQDYNSFEYRRHRTFADHPGSVVADIPAIFLQTQLELSKPNTFAQVFPGISISTDSGRQARVLQEKLSHYLDVVEVQIAQQVSQKSSAFFHAMTSQDTIMAEMSAATTNVQRLRRNIQQIDATLVNDSLTILSSERRRQNHLVALHKLKVMAEVHQTQPMIQQLLGTADYVAAIDLIGSTQELVAKELSGVHCFKHLPSQLHEMERLIDKMLTTDFEKYATADLNRPISTHDSVLSESVVLDEDKLVCIISGLLRQKNFQFIETYKEEATATVRAMIKEMLIGVLASGDKEICLTGAGEESQALSISEWVTLLETATIRLLKLLGRIRTVVDVMHRVADASAGRTRPDVFVEANDIFLPTADYQRVDQKLNELMHSICNYCHERCATLISSQSLEKSVATADQVEHLTRIVADFCVGCERLANVYSLPLQAALKAQATRFASKFHADRKSKLGFILDNERWRQADVPPEFQYLIDGIVNGSFAHREHDHTKETSNVLRVETEEFALVGSALILLQIITEYCRCATQLPVIEAQLARHVVDLLRTFNSRCCQLVLGAGALRVAGLKTITSTNLALVSRALQLVVWLLPHIRNHFYRSNSESPPATNVQQNGHPTTGVPNQPPTLASYDAVERDFVSHIKEVDAMILSIVSPLVTAQLEQWAARPPVPSQPFRNISRHFVKLHEAVAAILPVSQVHQLYRIVHRTFKDKLREVLMRNNIVNNGGPQHGVVTAELTFYVETLRTLNALPVEELNDEAMCDIWTR